MSLPPVFGITKYYSYINRLCGDVDNIILLYRVCYQQSSYSTAYFTYYQQLTYTSQHYTVGCGFLWLSRCNRYRSVSRYRSAPRTNYRAVYQSIPICCSGYSGSPPYNCQRKCCEYKLQVHLLITIQYCSYVLVCDAHTLYLWVCLLLESASVATIEHWFHEPSSTCIHVCNDYICAESAL